VFHPWLNLRVFYGIDRAQFLEDAESNRAAASNPLSILGFSADSSKAAKSAAKMANPSIGHLRGIPEKSLEDGHDLRRWPQLHMRVGQISNLPVRGVGFQPAIRLVPSGIPKRFAPPPMLARLDLPSSIVIFPAASHSQALM